jgi:Protein of unknown function (DUF3788)
MTDKQVNVLTDKNVIPTEELIFSLIGHNRIFWQRIMKFAAENYPDISGSWNYYADGRQWLVKDEFHRARKYGAVRPLSIIVREQADADNVITLISLKYKIK